MVLPSICFKCLIKFISAKEGNTFPIARFSLILEKLGNTFPIARFLLIVEKLENTKFYLTRGASSSFDALASLDPI